MTDPEKRRQRERERYHKNPEKRRQRARKHYQKNRAWLLEKERERRGSKKIDNDIDYTDLYPLDERNFGFRSWAVITSAEYAKELTAWQTADMSEKK